MSLCKHKPILTRPSRDCFLRRRFFLTLLQICGKLDGLPGPKRRENRSTLSGRKSGKSSRTSTLAYLDGSIAASGVSNFLSALISAVSAESDFALSELNWDFNGILGGGISSLSLFKFFDSAIKVHTFIALILYTHST